MKKIIGAAAAVAAAAVLAGCSTNSSAATTSSYCGYVMGNGSVQNGQAQSRDIKQVLRPNETKGFDSNYDQAKYFPCGPRNYRVGPGGDQQNALVARTATNIPVDVFVTLYWTPNQHDGALNNFITFCEKYQCATGTIDSAQGENFSSPGWNGMLAENVGPTLQRIAERAFTTIPDSVWQENDAAAKDSAAAAMEKAFGPEFQKTTGFADDIICGSGSSGDANTFDCQGVRIVVDSVVAQGGMQDQNAQAQQAERERSLKDAQAAADIATTNNLYGPDMGAKFRFCRDLGDKCKVIVTNGTPVVVQTP